MDIVYNLLYHPEVKNDISKLPVNIKERIKNAVEIRLKKAPFQYGTPLRKSLHNYWKLRIGNYRVIYKINGNNVIILKIGHRKEVYYGVEKRC